MDSCQRLIQNHDILANIFQYLSLEAQVDCAAICESFEAAISQRLWSRQHCHLAIHKTPYITIVTNSQREHEKCPGEGRMLRVCEYKSSLPYHKSKRFRAQVAPYVRNLALHSEYYSFDKNLGVAFQNIENFQQLRHLSFHQAVVTDQQLQSIGQHCVHIQKLELIECTCDELESLIPGYNLDISSLTSFRQLQHLVVQSEALESLPQMGCDVLHEMISNLPLSAVILENIKIFDNGDDVVANVNGAHVEILNVGNISQEYWPNFRHHLRDFRNLKDLTINVLNCNTLVDSWVFETLASHCCQLQKLSLENCDLCIEDFGVIKTLQHLSLLSCGGLTAENLQQALSGLPLRSLSLIKTRIFGTVIPCLVSPYLEQINIDSIHCEKFSDVFENALNSMDNLHTINWYNGNIRSDWIVRQCPNLRKLYVPNPHLLRHCILRVACLTQLSFSSCQKFTWYFLIVLIKSLPLQRLNICSNDVICDDENTPQDAADVETTLQRIVLPYRIYVAAEDFWMDLLCVNPGLKLIFYGDSGDLLNRNCFHKLLTFPHVRHRLKNMRMCGFSVEIADLQHRFEDTLQQLNTKTSHFRSRNCKFTVEL
uniref:F-box domain-containing protein n=1 Tax=Stomoxys calcitrans TaxID=35570 RepID=A0A1I8P142_STOCA